MVVDFFKYIISFMRLYSPNVKKKMKLSWIAILKQFLHHLPYRHLIIVTLVSCINYITTYTVARYPIFILYFGIDFVKWKRRCNPRRPSRVISPWKVRRCGKLWNNESERNIINHGFSERNTISPLGTKDG